MGARVRRDMEDQGINHDTTAPIVGAPPLAGPSAPPPTALTSMDVDYGSPLMDPPSEGDNDASGRHEDLDVPVSM